MENTLYARRTRQSSVVERCQFIPFVHRLLDAARGVVMPMFLTGTAVSTKSNATPVTDADKGAEFVMRRMIAARFPTHGIYGEEYGQQPPKGDFPHYRWILDPIDGTRAFISNSFLFGTLVALERDDGQGFAPIVGAIAHPAANVRAVGTSEGTTLTMPDGKRRAAHVRACPSIEKATMLVTSHWTKPEQVGDARLQRLVDRCRLYRTWGDCFGYFAVATGGADLMVDPDLSYWDVAALIPVVEGAGGVLTGFAGGNPLEELSAVCTAGGIHAEVLSELRRP